MRNAKVSRATEEVSVLLMMCHYLLLSASILWFGLAKPPAEEKIATARWILHQAHRGVLTTRLADDTDSTAFGNSISLVEEGGTPYFYVSLTDASMQDVQKNPKMTLTVTEATNYAANDPGDYSRLVLSGTMVNVIGQTDFDHAKSILFEQHPHMQSWSPRLIYKLQVEEIWLVSKGQTEVLSLQNYTDEPPPGGCVLDCENCKGPFYIENEDHSCQTRSTRAANGFYQFDKSCAWCPECTIRDAETCRAITDSTYNKMDDFMGNYEAVWISPSVGQKERGCHVKATDITVLDIAEIKGYACLGLVQTRFVLYTVGIAVLVGLISSYFHTRSQPDGSCFQPGCRVCVRNKLLARNGWQGYYVVFYRMTEEIDYLAVDL